MKKIFLLVMLLFPVIIKAQQLSSQWEMNLRDELVQFKACQKEVNNGINPCNEYIGQAVKAVYQLNDFYAAGKGRYMLVSEISHFLEESDQWVFLGHAYEEEALNKAQLYANENKAAVAVYLNEEGIGLVSIILPGEMKNSGTWGLPVPNSAAFFVYDPARSYIGKSLSYAFERRLLKEVRLYGRQY
ncbi:hypothetical protein [Nafulsella turpanensis]|uniref:hypothetical protein n=1 Tax=Nafulsella turpanensis TaxID=1265690 RepID=UPI0003721CD1|nr:hypothetical protein [Nafulsella turpanensis]